ncbi:hypothetical protein K5D44_00285 [Pseudomonas cichorii]|uniref:hypothetical protein n=1 Tax=Pseudomonas viridiflava TaxID=33069 RepID=UPI001C8AF8BA|nr:MULTISPECIES: hypothetical protein [Pseudomonas syringae group]MBX8563135.1 hypothetical protein [Pseudomonas cichorii]MCQ9391400.1 hypothetical protein [Pseudomonas viridiflava]
MIDLYRLISWLFPDRRPDWEQRREREFIHAANGLKTLRVTPEGGMFIDPEELREQIVASREQLKSLVRKPGSTIRLSEVLPSVATDEVLQPCERGSDEILDVVEVVAWRRLPTGAVVRYTCLQCVSTGRYSVAAASLFSAGIESLPPWVDSDGSDRIPAALQGGELTWYRTASDAMNAWDQEL